MLTVLLGLLSLLMVFFLIKYFPKQLAITVAGTLGLAILLGGACYIYGSMNAPKWAAESQRASENSRIAFLRRIDPPREVFPVPTMIWKGDHYAYGDWQQERELAELREHARVLSGESSPESPRGEYRPEPTYPDNFKNWERRRNVTPPQSSSPKTLYVQQ